MRRQKSFQNDLPSLYLVSTPIGNLEEMSPRAIDTLKNVSVIAAEDTRVSSKLLSVFDIHTKLISHHMHNEKESAEGILKLLRSGQHVALISDAGLPLISDPGYNLVLTIIEAGFNVIPIGIPSAALAALVVSGLNPQPYVFYGFLPTQDKALKQELNQLKSYGCTLIFYESPHRIKKTLQKILAELGDRKAVLAREITKIHEEILRGTLSELIEVVDDLKGEMVLVVEGLQTERNPDLDLSEIQAMIQSSMDAGLSASDAIKAISKQTGIPKNTIYQHFHQKEPS
jgi:16S rRNA (cytidine1402-2'-O)-methyltransferase